MTEEEAKAAGRASGRARRAIWALVAGALAIGLAAIFVRLREEGLGLSATAFWRLALALPLFWVWLAVEGRSGPGSAPRRFSRGDAVALMIPGLFFAGDLALWHWSIELTTVANATLFANCAPILVSLVAWLWMGERLRWVFVAGLVCALAGAAGVVGSSFELGAQNVRGDGLGLLTAVFYGAYILSVKRVRARFSTPVVMVWSIPVACAVLLVVALASAETLTPATARGWLVLLGLAVICQVGGQGLIAYALAHLPASFSCVSLLIQPVAAAVFAWLILDETLGPLQAGAGVLVLVGIYLARRGSRE